jgi:hypothetical protein
MSEATEATTELEVRVQEFKCAGAILAQATEHKDKCREELDRASASVGEARKELAQAMSRLLHAADPLATERLHW